MLILLSVGHPLCDHFVCYHTIDTTMLLRHLDIDIAHLVVVGVILKVGGGILYLKKWDKFHSNHSLTCVEGFSVT